MNETEKVTIWISVGELSGDRLAAWFLRTFPSSPALRWIGIAGPHLRKMGVQPLFPMEKLQGLGIGELKDLPLKDLLRLGKLLISINSQRFSFFHLQREKGSLGQISDTITLPNAAVFVDYGGFHLLLGTIFSQLGIPVAYLAPPKIWAWGKFRAKILRRMTPILGVLFPFENDFYRSLGFTDVVFVGHPVAELINAPQKPERSRFYLLPGSRPQEWRAHLPLLLEFIPVIRSYGLEPTLGIPPHLNPEVFAPLPPSLSQKIIRHPEDYHDGVLAIAASGTVNLELAALGIPHLVIYKPHPLTLWIGRRLVHLPWINPVNLVAGHEVLPEFLGEEAKLSKMLPYLQGLLKKQTTLSQILKEVVGRLYAPDGLNQFQEKILSLSKHAKKR